jgi:hypothetical protein
MREEVLANIREANKNGRLVVAQSLERQLRLNETQRWEELSLWKHVKYPWSEVRWPAKVQK